MEMKSLVHSSTLSNRFSSNDSFDSQSTIGLTNNRNNQLMLRKALENDLEYTEFASLQAKKTWIERNEIFNLFDFFQTISFKNEELVILQSLASIADEKFSLNNYTHLNMLKELFTVSFGLLEAEKNHNFLETQLPETNNQMIDISIEEFTNNSKWNHLGFQGSNPATDFRDGGILALKTLTHFQKQEMVTFKVIEDFNAQYENYLFACSVISAVQFLKIYFHFGILSNFSSHYVNLTCSRAILKKFLKLCQKTEGGIGQESFFIRIVVLFVKQMFRFWCEENARLRLFVVDFNRIENQFKRIWRKHLRAVFRKWESDMSVKTFLTLLARGAN